MVTNRKLADLGSAVDSAATGNFLTVDDSGGKFRSIAYSEIASRPTVLDSAAAQAIIDSSYIQARQTDVGLDSSQITSLVDSSYITARQSTTGLDSAGALNLVDSAYLSARATAGLDSSKVTNLIDSDYISGKAAVNSGFKTFTYFASDGQTDFSGSDYNGEVLSYTADGIIVWLNGVQILDTDDYTASNGTSVALTTGADSGASLVVGSWALGGSGGSSGIPWGGARGFSMHGYNYVNVIEYVSIPTPGNAQDFGDLLSGERNSASASNGTTIIVAGGYDNSNETNVIQSFASATTGNSSDFGDLTIGRAGLYGHGDGTYGLFAGGGIVSPPGSTNTIDYITVASAGNAQDFGDLLGATNYGSAGGNSTRTIFQRGQDLDYVASATPGNASDFGDAQINSGSRGGDMSSATRMLLAGGYTNGMENTIDLITIDTTGNATDFGDLSVAVLGQANASDGTTAIMQGGNNLGGNEDAIQYVTIATEGNSQDFGDLTAQNYNNVGASGAAS